MPRYDDCHPQVVRALEKAGWTVNDAPFKVKRLKRQIYIGLEATRHTNGSQQQILLAEVKCFPDTSSVTTELYTAIGQYLIYQAMLAELRIEMPLYLAIPEETYNNEFDMVVHRAITDSKIKLLIVNLESERVTQWIE